MIWVLIDEEWAGVKISGYELLQAVYKSATTLVWRALRQADGRPVVLKMPHVAHPPAAVVEKYRQEFELLQAVRSPGVIQAYALEAQGHRPVLVLEETGGVPLQERLRGGRLGVEECLHMAVSLVRALGDVHKQGIVHKDLNPANVLVDGEEGAVKIIDFGIAMRPVAGDPDYAPRPQEPSLLEGTLAYLSPEQTGRIKSRVDYRTDFYSFGAMLYEMLTGRTVFQAQDPLEMVHAHLAKTPLAPHEAVSDIPRPLSDIVMKCLSKSAADRYAGAYGLLADLEHCQRQWQQTGEIPPFELAARDVSAQLELPSNLYGREGAEALLAAAYERAEQGGREWLLVSGPAGIGKTSFVRQIQPIMRRRSLLKQAEQGHSHDRRPHHPRTPANRSAMLAVGKFEQLRRDVPYGPLMQAFQDLIRQLLSQPEAEVQRWKADILEAVEGNGRVLLDVLPALERLIGPQPEVATLPPQEMQNRFHRTITHFVRLFARPEHPLVLLLDDLQWADAASLGLLELFLADGELRHLLIIGTCREEEVEASHPLRHTLQNVRQTGAEVEEIHLGPLQADDLIRLLGDALKAKGEQTEALARLLMKKTEGNPFFIKQLLRSLADSRLLSHDPALGGWHWEVERIQRHAISGSLADLLVARLQRLPKDSLQALTVAACLGNTFELQTLAAITGHTPEESWQSLQAAVDEGLLDPVEPSDPLEKRAAATATATPAVLCFQHDRVQHAAYCLLSEPERQHLHHQIARLLREPQSTAHHTLHVPPERLFDIANHYHASLPCLTEQEERLAAARLFLQAGRKAKSSSAYAPALTYLRTGAVLLDEAAWHTERPLMMALQLERAEAEYLCGHLEAAEHLFAHLLDRAETDLEKVAVFRSQMVLYTQLFQHEKVIRIARQALRLLGVQMPENPGKRAIVQELLTARFRIGKRTPDDLYNLPQIRDPRMKEALQILTNTNVAAYFEDHNLWAWIVLKVLNLSLRYGNCAESSFGYGGYGMILGAFFGDYRTGCHMSEMACLLSDEYADPTYRCRMYYSYGALGVHWNEHVQVSIDQLKKAHRLGLECGDFTYACFSVGSAVSYLNFAGVPLAEIEQEMDTHAEFVERINLALIANSFRLNRSWIDTLRTGADVSEWSAEGMREDVTGITEFLRHLFRLQAFYLFGRYDEALREAEEAEVRLPSVVSQMHERELAFFHALILTKLAEQASPRTKRRHLRRVRRLHRRLKRWADVCPANNDGKWWLIQAELARLEHRDSTAITAYENALQSARENGFLHNEAIAAERAADFYLARGSRQAAAAYLKIADGTYQHWGAAAKAKQLADEYPGLLLRQDARSPEERTPDAATVDMPPSFSGTATRLLDLLSVVKASQAISGEIVLSQLLAKLMQLLLENAGAERGCLLLEQDGDWRVMAAGDIDRPVHFPDAAIADHPAVCSAVVQYAARSGELVVLADASRQGPFTDDPYIRQTQARSILCLPVSHQAKQYALFYVENNLTPGAFTPEHVEVLNVLAGQFAISLENARLYASLEQSRDQLADALAQLEEHSLTLEGKVRERTADLELTNRQLRRTMRENANSLAEIAVLEERNRIAHDIHDIVGHTLTATIVQLEAGLRLLDSKPAVAAEKFELCQELIGKGLNEIRRAVRMMRDDTNTLDLAPALVQLIQETEKYAAVIIDYDIHPLPDLSSSQKKVLFHALQEGLTNGIRHGGSTRFSFELAAEADHIRFRLQDNGSGGSEPPQYGFGLTAMQERVESLGGELHFTTTQEQGSRLHLQLPIKQSAVS